LTAPFRTANEHGSVGARDKNAGAPDRQLNNQMSIKKHEQSRNGKGGKTGRRKRPSTAAQRRAHGHLARPSRGWSELTDEQRTAWRRRAAQMGRLVRKGKYYRLNGQQLYNKINSVLALLGRAAVTDPPPLPRFGENPVEAFQITGTGDRLALKLTLSGAPTEDLMVFASPPYSAGREYCGDYRFIGLLPIPVEHVSEIARLYFKKFGAPPANTRVFIRVWQEVDGWECRGQRQLLNALVPAKGAAAEGRRGSRARGKRREG
jgi:hypothetical protein